MGYVLSMLGDHSERRWPNIKTTLFQCVVSAGPGDHRERQPFIMYFTSVLYVSRVTLQFISIK